MAHACFSFKKGGDLKMKKLLFILLALVFIGSFCLGSAMAKEKEDIVAWIPIKTTGQFEFDRIKYEEGVKEELKGKLPIKLPPTGVLLLEESHNASITKATGSPGCIWFIQDGVLVKFCW